MTVRGHGSDVGRPYAFCKIRQLAATGSQAQRTESHRAPAPIVETPLRLIVILPQVVWPTPSLVSGVNGSRSGWVGQA
jgi:hypothetical protein